MAQTVEKRWQIQQTDEERVQQIAQALHISTIAAKVLVARGYTTVEQASQFLMIDETSMHDPYDMYGMEQAVARIQQAIEQKQHILVYGDYDADGITSSTVMKTVLQDLGAHVSHQIPNRFIDGYGPSERLFRQAKEDGVDLIITVDNGIAGNKVIEIGKEIGLDIIVTDHHEAGDELPHADFIIHPRHPKGNYPFGELAGVGVAFKVAHALYGYVPESLLEIVAIGTVADLVPLVDENRYFVKKGLELMQHSQRPAIQALMKICGVEPAEVTEESIGFAFGPRLNALGRLGDANPGVDFMMATDSDEAAFMANQLNEKNKERQAIVAQITEDAIQMVENIDEIGQSQVLVIAEEGWNPGVVGIVASRLVEKYYKPTIVLGVDLETGMAKGSARSITGFNMFKEVGENRDLMTAFGGHPMAAGMTLAVENIDELRSRLHYQATQCLTEEERIPVLNIDIPLDLAEIDVDAIEDLRKLAPFGVEFEKPKYGIQNTKIKSMRKIGSNENHVKMEIGEGYKMIDAVGFNKGYLADELTYGIDVSFAGDLQVNEWRGNRKPQFLISDVHTDEWQLFDIRGGNKISQWLNKIPVEKTTFLAFKKETVAFYDTLIPTDITYYSEDLIVENCFPYIVLLDLPQNQQELSQVIQRLSPTRIYVHFHVENSHLFDEMPTREQFTWYYSFLKKRREFHLRQHLNDLAKHKGWSRKLLIFMTQVFFELEFVTIEGGLAKIVDHPKKQPLESAAIYKQRTEQIALEKLLLYANYTELRQWFENQMNSQAVSEEEHI